MEITAVCVVGFIVLGIYKIFELFVKKSERMALIEKLTVLGENKEINIPTIYFKSNNAFSSLRIALLLIGVGIGCILAFYMQYYYFDFYSKLNLEHWQVREQVNQIKFVLNFSFIATFGGLGLLIAYLIESKKLKKEE